MPSIPLLNIDSAVQPSGQLGQAEWLKWKQETSVVGKGVEWGVRGQRPMRVLRVTY